MGQKSYALNDPTKDFMNRSIVLLFVVLPAAVMRHACMAARVINVSFDIYRLLLWHSPTVLSSSAQLYVPQILNP